MTTTTSPLLWRGLTIGLGLGILLGAGAMSTIGKMHSSHKMDHSMHKEMDHSMHAGHGGHHHMHEMLEVDPSLPVPTVDLRVSEDSMGGYNVQVLTSNFQFAPERVNGEPIPGEGHAHIFVNDRKVTRLYGSWYHLAASELREGSNEIKVTLNANDHSEWVVSGQHVEASTMVER